MIVAEPFETYFDAMPCYLTVQTRDLRLLQANRRFREDFGEIEGRYCYQVYKGRPEKCEECPVERTYQDGLPHQSRERVTTRDGREVAVLVNTTPIRNDAGDITAVLEMSTDVTDMSRLERQLRRSQEKYRLLFEEVPCFISIQNRDLSIVEANRLHRETFGTCYGDKCYRAYKHREEACNPCVVQRTFEDGQVHVHEELVTSAAGDPINVMVTTAPLLGRDGRVDLVMELSADITQVRQLQSQLSSLGLIISSISHDLKGLLSGLDGGIYLVNTGLEKDDRKRLETGWEMVLRNVGQIRGTVLDILYFSKDRKPEVEQVAAADLLPAVIETCRGKAESHGIVLSCHDDGDLGMLEADVRAIRSMLTNLVDNAIDACRLDQAKSEHAVEVRIRGTEDAVEIEISDNGQGMTRETREKAFTLFFSSKGTGGTGLGLFIANRIARSHGGTIELVSEVGVGTTFTVALPRTLPAQVTAETENDNLESPEESSSTIQ